MESRNKNAKFDKLTVWRQAVYDVHGRKFYVIHKSEKWAKFHEFLSSGRKVQHYLFMFNNYYCRFSMFPNLSLQVVQVLTPTTRMFSYLTASYSS